MKSLYVVMLQDKLIACYPSYKQALASIRIEANPNSELLEHKQEDGTTNIVIHNTFDRVIIEGFKIRKLEVKHMSKDQMKLASILSKKLKTSQDVRLMMALIHN